MKLDVAFYLSGTIDERLPKLTAPESPLMLEKKEDGAYFLCSRNPGFERVLIYQTPELEILEEPTHIDAQKTFGFQPESQLYIGECILDEVKTAEFRKIRDYLVANNIPTYITDNDRIDMLYGPNTSNPETPRFEKTLPDLLK